MTTLTSAIPADLQHLVMTAEEAASLIQNGDTVAFNCFGPSGGPKAVPRALAQTDTKIRFIGGASSSIDDLLVSNMISRTPYQQQPETRRAIANGDISFVEMHLAELTQQMRYMHIHPDFAVVEASYIGPYGIDPTSTVGSFYEFLELSDRIIVEYNEAQPNDKLREMMISHYNTEALSKIVAIVITNEPDPERDTTIKDAVVGEYIGQNVIEFLDNEIVKGRLNRNLKPLEFGVGTITDAVARSMARGRFGSLTVRGEVLMDSIIDLYDAGNLGRATGTGLYLSDKYRERLFSDKMLRGRITMLPVTETNDGAKIKLAETIAINGLIEVSLAGEGNSSFLNGSFYNGIGGSVEFAQNALISIFVLPSTAKRGKISTIQPKLSHTDHIGPNVDVIVTEQGYADLRRLNSRQRALQLIKHCAHPDFKLELLESVK